MGKKGWNLRRKRTMMKVPATGWVQPLEATSPNEIWTMGFIFDKTKRGGQLMFLNVLDEGCRECLEIRAETQITGRVYCRLLMS